MGGREKKDTGIRLNEMRTEWGDMRKNYTRNVNLKCHLMKKKLFLTRFKQGGTV